MTREPYRGDPVDALIRAQLAELSTALVAIAARPRSALDVAALFDETVALAYSAGLSLGLAVGAIDPDAGVALRAWYAAGPHAGSAAIANGEDERAAELVRAIRATR